jgi:hypothetical protein
MEIGTEIEDMIINFKFEFNKVFTNYKVFVLKVEFKMLENNTSLENIRHIQKGQKFPQISLKKIFYNPFKIVLSVYKQVIKDN